MPYHTVSDHPDCPASKPIGVVNTATGEKMGCHATMQDAEDQMAALHAKEPMMASQERLNAPRENLIRGNFSDRATAVEGRTMTGYPIVFDQWTTINSWEGEFKERIAPGAVTRTLKNNGGAVKVLFNHGMDPSIGDKPLGKPSVMRADDVGLYVEVPLADTSYNDDLLALMRDGVLDGQSFRFSVVKDEWTKPKRGPAERTVTELKLYEFGPVTFPAYQATTVALRQWSRLDEDTRSEIARLMGISFDLRTLDDEPGTEPFTGIRWSGEWEATSSDGLATEHPTDSQGAALRRTPQISRHDALEAVALLRSCIK